MTLLNSYATLLELQQYISTTDTDTADDAVTENILAASSRFMDAYCGRSFYPRIETRSFNLPDEEPVYLDDDLLSLTTLKHGDSDTISSSDYILLSTNYYPKWGIKIRDISSEYWETDVNSSAEEAIKVTGEWGYHERYVARGWVLGTTLSAALNASATTFAASDNHTLLKQQIVKIDSEIMNVTGISSSDTVAVHMRGDNGSTAATHTSDTAVYYWSPMDEIKFACLEIAVAAYRRRKGQFMSGTAKVTGAGVVITPQDVPGQAREILEKYKRVT